MDLIYNGILSPSTARAVLDLLEEFPHVIEICGFGRNWREFNEWQAEECPTYPVRTDNEMGGYSYTRHIHLYSLMSRNPDVPEEGTFLFLKSQKEKDLFLKRFEKQVINPNPFQIKLKIG